MGSKTKIQTKYGVTATVGGISVGEDVRNFSTRRRNLLYLMHRYLLENGYSNSADALKAEGRLSDEYELCDNVDLDSIYLEYASFFNLKFGKYPRILKKSAPTVKVDVSGASGSSSGKSAHGGSKQQKSPTQEQRAGDAVATWHVGVGAATVAAAARLTSEPQLQIKKLVTATPDASGGPGQAALGEIEHGHARDDALFTSLDWQGLSELIKTTILCEDYKLRWSDVCGNQRAIEVIREAVITPIEYPQLFALGLKPWRSVLLHGPPGSGKTFLAKVLYAETQANVTFFNISASIMVSKWRGESEKILRVLFYMAARRAPAVIFFDEIESLTSHRDRPNDHESSKRFKNELLQLLDGMEHTLNGVFVLASTNLPWDIDEAFLRRFEKKLLVQLPNATERGSLISRMLGASVALSPPLLEQLVQLSEHFTGDEIRLACKEVSMESVRRATRPKVLGEPIPTPKMTAALLEQSLVQAFKQVRPSGLKLMTRHVQWQQENGS